MRSSFNNISNILRDVYGEPPYNTMKSGENVGKMWWKGWPYLDAQQPLHAPERVLAHRVHGVRAARDDVGYKLAEPFKRATVAALLGRE